MCDFFKFSEVNLEIDRVLKEFNYKSPVVAAKIYGIHIKLSEIEVRALQVLAKRAANESTESFVDFCDNIIIYSHPDIHDDGCHQMVFRPDGKFENEFAPGFYDVNANLAFEIF